MSNRRSNTTIYREANTKSAAFYENPAIVSFSENDLMQDDGDTLTFSEESESPLFSGDLRELTVGEALEPLMGDSEGSLEDIIETAEETLDMAEGISEEYGDKKLMDLLPGADVSLSDLADDGEEKETDYLNDKDLSKFMEYVSEMYPAKIPKHDGTSTVGCERAISFLDRMNGDISRAIRDDHDNILDVARLEDVRLNIMRDFLL